MKPLNSTERRLAEKLAGAEQIQARNVSKYFVGGMSVNGGGSTRTVLKTVNLEVKAGAIIGLAGPTGTGKSTLGRIMMGILSPDLGTVHLDSVDLFKLSPAEHRFLRRWLRYVPQNPDAVASPRRKVLTVLEDGLRASLLNESDQATWYASVCREDLIDHTWLARKMSGLSLGQRRRIITARGLLSCPKFMVLDEPFNGLDSRSKEYMLNILREASRKWGVGILLVSHDTDALVNVSDAVWQLYEGTLHKWS